MNTSQLLKTAGGLGRPRLLVLGDLILDRYTWADAERVSQEAPVLLLRVKRRDAKLGGAGAVCQMVDGLEADVACAGVVGDDVEGLSIGKLLGDTGIDHTLLLADPSRPTTVKERFMGRASSAGSHQVLRVDSEVRDPLPRPLQQRLWQSIEPRLRDFDAVLISDYDKGVCTPWLLGKLIPAARRAGRPVIVDPVRATSGAAAFKRYRGATTMTPNRLEAELATGIKIVTSDDAAAAGKVLCRDYQLDVAVITMDRDGMALVDGDGQVQTFPTRARSVYDITGAGDMVLSMIGVALAAGVEIREALELANVAAGLEVEHLGVAVVGRDEVRAELSNSSRAAGKHVTLDQMEQIAGQLRDQGRRLVFTNGCFDLLHVGHVRNLQEAAAQGDTLVVALNSDESIRRLKGPHRPVIGQQDRAAILGALDCVDYVLIFNADTPDHLLRRLRPDVLVKGGAYDVEQVVGHEIVTRYGGRVHLTGHVAGISTTRILDSIAAGHAPAGPHFATQNIVPGKTKKANDSSHT